MVIVSHPGVTEDVRERDSVRGRGGHHWEDGQWKGHSLVQNILQHVNLQVERSVSDLATCRGQAEEQIEKGTFCH